MSVSQAVVYLLVELSNILLDAILRRRHGCAVGQLSSICWLRDAHEQVREMDDGQVGAVEVRSLAGLRSLERPHERAKESLTCENF